ncbi:MAG: sulfatase-like hydrolase/transferase [Deltaproteobacteria bacterium]|nr:sulfatase-like hydrolase/transferase [Deltaproteobacteria bacterium]
MFFKGKIHQIVRLKMILFALFFMVGSILIAGCSKQEETATAPVPEAVEPVHETEVAAPEFKGKVAKSYQESEEWWPEPVLPPEGAPNVIIFLLDDVGFAQVGSFGGLIETPNIDLLADGGLRYNNFHTTALCSPSRASLMAGRNPHAIGLGSHALTAMGFPGYNAIVPETAKSVANYLQETGYVNYALGKWDHTPLYEVSQVGPFHRWPSGEGFEHAYTFMSADVHQFIPVMWNDHTPEPYRKTYHLDKDLADRAIDWITGHKSIKPELPFMMLWASGSMHSPHHAPAEYLEKYRGKFDMGWDKAREMILAKQKELGIIPANTKLTERIPEIPAWDSLNDEEKKLYARQMEAFAAQMEHVDFQIGRVVDVLERIGEMDNTLIFVTADNGASGEGGLAGTFNETYVLNGLQTPFDGRANTAAVNTMPWWSIGRKASRPRARSVISTTTSSTLPQPSWRRPACPCRTATTA